MLKRRTLISRDVRKIEIRIAIGNSKEHVAKDTARRALRQNQGRNVQKESGMQSCNHVDPTRPSRQLFRHSSRKFARIPSSVSIRLETPTWPIAVNRRSLPRASLLFLLPVYARLTGDFLPVNETKKKPTRFAEVRFSTLNLGKSSESVGREYVVIQCI